MSDVAAAMRVPDRTRSGHGFFPFFRMTAASALLASLLFKFSQVIAPEYHLQNFVFMAFLAYLYFALGRAVFVSSHASCFPRSGRLQSSVAFGLWFGALRWRAQLVGAAALLAGACLDAVVAPLLGQEATFLLLYRISMLAWLTMAPMFLVAVARGASRGAISALRGQEPAIRSRRLLAPWLITVLLIAILDTAGGRFAYYPLRAIVAYYLPDGRAIYLYSVAYYACQIWINFWIHAWFVKLAILPSLVAPRGDLARRMLSVIKRR